MGAQPPLGLLVQQIINHKSPILRAGAYTKTQQSHAIPMSHGISWGWKSWEIPGLLRARGHREKFVAMSCVTLHTTLGLCDPRDVGRYGRHGGALDTEPGNCCVFLQARKWVISSNMFHTMNY
jgi:hypothetical protein